VTSLALTRPAERRRYAWAAASLTCAVALAGFRVHPALGAGVAVLFVVLAAMDWHVPLPALASTFVVVTLLIPAGLRIGGALPADLSADRVVLGVVLLAWVMGLLEIPDEPLQSDARRSRGALLVLLGVAFVSLAVNEIQPTAVTPVSDALKNMLVLLGYVGTYALVLVSTRSRGAVERVCAWAAGAGVIAALSGIVERLTSSNPIRQALLSLPGIHQRQNIADTLTRGSGVRIFGTGEHPIAFGGAMAMLVPVAAYLAIVDAKHRVLWIWAALVMGLAMLLTVSRSAVIAALIGAFVLLFAWPKYRLGLVSIGVAAVLAVHVFMPGLLGTLRATLSPSYIAMEESASNQDNRSSDYPKVAEIVPHQPLLGLGWGNFTPDRYFYLDNQALKLLLELGMAGVVAFVAFCWCTIASLVRAIRAGPDRESLLAGALLASIVVFLTLSLFFDSFSFVQVAYLFFAFSALGMNVAERREVL
jgi:hypothetical protein